MPTDLIHVADTSLLLDNPKERHSLLRASFHSYLSSFISAIVPRLCLTAFTFAQPFLVTATLNFIDRSEVEEAYGRGLIGAWALVYLGLAVSRYLSTISSSHQPAST
jgi:hypothetical protein